MLTADKQNELRKKYYQLRGELIASSMEYGDALQRREKQPSFWHHFEVASERKQKAVDQLDAYLAECNVSAQERHGVLRTLMFTCQELASARVRQENFLCMEEKTIERQAAIDEMNSLVFGFINAIK